MFLQLESSKSEIGNEIFGLGKNKITKKQLSDLDKIIGKMGLIIGKNVKMRLLELYVV